MSKGLAIKDALKMWEDKHQKSAAESTVVKLYMMQPFIVKMDASLSVLVKCEYYSNNSQTSLAKLKPNRKDVKLAGLILS